jgi:hypothetical protein
MPEVQLEQLVVEPALELGIDVTFRLESSTPDQTPAWQVTTIDTFLNEKVSSAGRLSLLGNYTHHSRQSLFGAHAPGTAVAHCDRYRLQQYTIRLATIPSPGTHSTDTDRIKTEEHGVTTIYARPMHAQVGLNVKFPFGGVRLLATIPDFRFGVSADEALQRRSIGLFDGSPRKQRSHPSICRDFTSMRAFISAAKASISAADDFEAAVRA